MTIDAAYQILYDVTLGVLGILMFACLIRTIIGPKIADRIVAGNMTGTFTMIIISVLALRMNEGYLADVAMIYAMLSFLAVVLLTRVYMGAYIERKQREKEEKNNG